MGRLFTLIIKELRMILRNRQARMVIIVPVLLQVAIFPFAATMEIRNASIGIYDEDGGKYARELTQRLERAAAFTHVMALRGDQAVREALDNQEVLLVVRFSPEFSSQVAANGSAAVQVALDGRRSNGGQIAMNYIQSIFEQYRLELMEERGQGVKPRAELQFRDWYNPNLDDKWFVLPSLVALITTIGVLILTSLSVAREREQGTMEQLLVSPLGTGQIFLGKAAPALLIAMFQGSVILGAAVFVYHIPFSGSLPLFYGSMLIYCLSLIGVGLLVSALSETQQQSFIGVFMFLMPAILLSGYISPVENMPIWFQYVSEANPIRHFVEIAKLIYLKDASFAVVRERLGIMLIIAACTSGVAYAAFRRKVA